MQRSAANDSNSSGVNRERVSRAVALFSSDNGSRTSVYTGRARLIEILDVLIIYRSSKQNSSGSSRKSQKTYGASDIDQSSGHASENEFDVRKARS